MKRISIFSAIIGLLVYGCSFNEEVYNNYHKEGDKRFRVTVEQPVFNETRAHLDGLKVVFDNEDKIAVFDNNTAKSEYTYSITDSSTEPEFSGTSSAAGDALEGIYALYPYSAAGSYNSGTLPDEQTYSENSFSNESQIMYGQTDDIKDGFNLKNMCGYIRLHLYGDNVFVKEITLSVTGGGEYVSGDFQIGASDEDDDYALSMNSEGVNQKQSVKLVCPDGGVELGSTSGNATVFYIALPPQTYTQGFSVTITDKFGREFTKTAFTNGGFELKRNHIKPMEALEVAFGADELEILADEKGNQYIEIKTDSPERLLKWAYTVNNFDNTLGFVLEGNITMPSKEIEEDPVNKTYRITETEITVTDGVPSGSNWIPITMYENQNKSGYFTGNIEGGNYSIDGLFVKSNNVASGFVGWMHQGAEIKNLTIKNAVIHNLYTGNAGETYTGAVVGRSHNGTLVENVHVVNSKITGKAEVGGIVGRNYRRKGGSKNYNEELAYIKNCTTDADTEVKGTGDLVGGICGLNYGAVIIGSTNNADVSGNKYVGGVAGGSQDYWGDKNNETRIYDGYIIGCGSTMETEIDAAQYAGGIVGYTRADVSGHKYTKCYIVACFSNSTSSGIKSMIGNINSRTNIIASWANNNGSLTGGAQPTLVESNHYADASEVTQDIVEQMNQVIATYNNTTGVEQKCPYIWKWTSGSWPVLELAPENVD